MESTASQATARIISAEELRLLIRQIPLLANLKEEELACLGAVELVEAPMGTVLFRQGETLPAFCMLLDGEVRATRTEANGVQTPLGVFRDGDSFGEAPLLLGAHKSGVECVASSVTRMLR